MAKHLVTLRRNRSQEEIVADILKPISQGTNRTKTHIMYHANLSYALTCKYINTLIEAGLIISVGNKYELTEKGLNYLKMYTSYKRYLDALQNNEYAFNEKKAVLQTFLTSQGSGSEA